MDLGNNSDRRSESLLPEYKSWESGPKVQKNNNPGVEGLRFEKNNREASATSARDGGRYGRSRSREKCKPVREKKEGGDRSGENLRGRGNEDRRRSREKIKSRSKERIKSRSREEIRSRSRDRTEEIRSRNRKKPPLSLRSREDGRSKSRDVKSRSREDKRSRSREEVKRRSRVEVKNQVRPKSCIERNYQEDEKSSRVNKRSRSREKARSRSKNLGRSGSSERLRSKSGETIGSRVNNQAQNDFSPISSNSEDKGDGDEKRREELGGEENPKKEAHWKCKGEVVAGKETQTSGIVKQGTATAKNKSQIGEKRTVKAEAVERE